MDTSSHITSPQFLAGITLAVLAAVTMLLSDVSVAAPITLLIVGIVDRRHR